MRSEPRGAEKPVTIDPDNPVYQVTFWERLAQPGELPEAERGFEASSWKVSEADVTEVLAWARERAGSRQTYVVEVAATAEDGCSELLRLYGQDPTIFPFDGEPFRLADQ
jgi:hypothetical protein